MGVDVCLDLCQEFACCGKLLWDRVETLEGEDEGLGLVGGCFLLFEIIEKSQDLRVCMDGDILESDAKLSRTILSKLI